MTAALAFFDTTLGKWVLMLMVAVATGFACIAYGESRGYERGIDAGAKQHVEEERAYLGMLSMVTKGLKIVSGKYEALKKQKDRELADAEARRLFDLKTQAERLTHDLPDALGSVVLPYGYFVHRYNAAQLARGDGARLAAPAGPGDAAAPGLSLATIATLDDGQADAYRACRERVALLDQYVNVTLPAWRDDVNRAIQGASKGAPP